MARSGRRGEIRVCLRRHRRKKAALWTHGSVLEAWDKVRDAEVVEREGLFRHIYRADTRADRLNLPRRYKALQRVAGPDLGRWTARGR